MTELRPIRFDLADAENAVSEWGFNCGPAALCAVLHMTPTEIRPHLGDFERKGYTNIRLMREILARLNVRYRTIQDYPGYGLVLIQWGGPWTRPGVPARAACRHTHWIGVRHREDGERQIFDVNAVCVGGWLPWDEWRLQLVPWLLKQLEPKADGNWWPKLCLEVESYGHAAG